MTGAEYHVRCNQAANAAIAPARCDVAILSSGAIRIDGARLTSQQRAVAQAAAEAVDRRPRRMRRMDSLVAEIEAFIGSDAARVRRAAAIALAALLRLKPNALEEFGVNIRGDEPQDPAP